MSKATKKTIIFTLIAIAEILIIGLLPAESEMMSRAGWQYLGIFAALLTLSISNAMPGFAIGLLEALVSAVGLSIWKDGVVFAILIVVLLVKPTGILGRPQTEKV
mgnify:CR=1 FL=1